MMSKLTPNLSIALSFTLIFLAVRIDSGHAVIRGVGLDHKLFGKSTENIWAADRFSKFHRSKSFLEERSDGLRRRLLTSMAVTVNSTGANVTFVQTTAPFLTTSPSPTGVVVQEKQGPYLTGMSTLPDLGSVKVLKSVSFELPTMSQMDSQVSVNLLLTAHICLFSDTDI